MQHPVHKPQARCLRIMGALGDMGRSTPFQAVCGTAKFLTVLAGVSEKQMNMSGQ